MRLFKMFFFILPSLSVPVAHASLAKGTVLVCYGRLDPEMIKGYGCVILESEHYTGAEIKMIKSQNDKVLAYISLGEVNKNARHYPQLKNNTLGKNTVWDSYYLNLKDPETSKILMAIIDEQIAAGYDGFFLDNLDNYTRFGPQPDQKPEVVALLKAIFEKYPDQTFLQNAGLELIGETAAFIDGLLVESVATDYTFNDKKYRLRDETGFRALAAKLAAIKQAYKIPVILVEYADTTALRDSVDERLTNSGFDYFIGNINLQTLPKFSSAGKTAKITK